LLIPLNVGFQVADALALSGGNGGPVVSLVHWAGASAMLLSMSIVASEVW